MVTGAIARDRRWEGVGVTVLTMGTCAGRDASRLVEWLSGLRSAFLGSVRMWCGIASRLLGLALLWCIQLANLVFGHLVGHQRTLRSRCRVLA